MAVCERSYRLLASSAYAGQFIGIAPAQEKTPQNWCHAAGTIRAASESKGSAHASGGGCC